MKKILSLLIISIFITSSSFAWPFGKREPKPQPTPRAVEKTNPPTISGGRDLLAKLKIELEEALKENTNLGISLAKAKKETEIAEGKSVELQKKVDDLTKWGLVQQAEKDKYIKKYDAAMDKYRRLKMIAACIAAAVGVLIGLQFMNFAPPPYNFAVPIGAAALFAGLVWTFF